MSWSEGRITCAFWAPGIPAVEGLVWAAALLQSAGYGAIFPGGHRSRGGMCHFMGGAQIVDQLMSGAVLAIRIGPAQEMIRVPGHQNRPVMEPGLQRTGSGHQPSGFVGKRQRQPRTDEGKFQPEPPAAMFDLGPLGGLVQAHFAARGEFEMRDRVGQPNLCRINVRRASVPCSI